MISDRNSKLKKFYSKNNHAVLRRMINQNMERAEEKRKVYFKNQAKKFGVREYKNIQNFMKKKQKKIRDEYNSHVLLGFDSRPKFTSYYLNRKRAVVEGHSVYRPEETIEVKKNLKRYSKILKIENLNSLRIGGKSRVEAMIKAKLQDSMF